MLLWHQGREKPVSILSDKFCEEQSFPYLLPVGKFGSNSLGDILISPACYVNQRLLNVNQFLASDTNYVLYQYMSSTTYIYQ